MEGRCGIGQYVSCDTDNRRHAAGWVGDFQLASYNSMVRYKVAHTNIMDIIGVTS